MVAYIGLSTQPVYYNARRIVGAKVYTYDAGTNTPRTAYADGLANTEHDWPFLTDANGCIPPFWVSGPAIKVVITTPTGSVIRTIDDIPGDRSTDAAVTPGTGTTIPPGFMMSAHRTGQVSGWVRVNGRTIGNALSGATERANDDTSDLFTVLWNDSLLSVSGGRGASAADDFLANKTITLPDYRGRGFVGLADMGGATSTRLDGVTFAAGNKTTLGSTAGAATRTLLEGNIPGHTHTGSTSTAAAHTHPASSASGGSHSGSVVSNGSHIHAASQAAHNHVYTATSVSGASVQGGVSGINSANLYATGTDFAQPAVYISYGGDHSHSFSVPAHQHTITVNDGGAHSHVFTTDATGSGTSFEIVQPFMTTTIYMKL